MIAYVQSYVQLLPRRDPTCVGHPACSARAKGRRCWRESANETRERPDPVSATSTSFEKPIRHKEFLVSVAALLAGKSE
jgi:hypothetical protein